MTGMWSLWLPFPPSKNNWYETMVVPAKGCATNSITLATALRMGRRALFAINKKNARAASYVSNMGTLIRAQIGQPPMIDDHCRVDLTLFPPDRKRRDAHNYELAVHDAFTTAGFWTDDSVVKFNQVEMGEVVPKARSCCHVLIQVMPDWQPTAIDRLQSIYPAPSHLRAPQKPLLLGLTDAMRRREERLAAAQSVAIQQEIF